MKSIFRIFFRAASTKPVLVLACMVLAGLFEMVSLGALVPLIGHLGGGGNTRSDSQMSEFIESLMGFIGLSNTFETMVIFVVAAMMIKSVLSFGAHAYVAFTIAKVVSVMRANLVRQMLNARWSYFADQRSGRIANSISNDATRAGGAYQRSARFVAFVVQALFYVIAALLISRELAIIGILVGLILVVSLGWLIKISRKAGYKQTDSTSDLVTYVSDTMNNMKPLKAMERQAPFLELFSRQIRTLRKSLVRQSLAKFGRSYGHEGLVALFIGIAVYIATKQFNTPLSELVVAGIIFFQVTTLISRLQATLQDAAELESAFWRLDNMLKSTAAAAETNPGTLTPSLETSAIFSKVSFAHGDTPVVNDVDVEFPAKQITVLQGGSGAGKTTIIDLLIGLHRPVEGTIYLDGVPLSDIDLKAWRRMIGYVPQELSLFHGTIRENITLGDETLSDAQVANAVKRAGAAGFIDRLPEGVETIAGEMGAKLSGGQRQRIALARALVTEPALLILDEVTSALDPETEREIVANIKELTRDYTIITVTHRPAWTAIADRLYSVKAGRVNLVTSTKSQAFRQVWTAGTCSCGLMINNMAPGNNTIEIRPVAGKQDLDAFLQLPFRLYQDDPNWVPPLHLERRDHLSPKNNPYYQHAEVQLFTAWRGDVCVGRISAQICALHQERYNDHCGQFGFVEAEDDPEVFAALFEAAEAWLRGRGMQRVCGPFNHSINEEVGLLVEGFQHPPSIPDGARTAGI